MAEATAATDFYGFTIKVFPAQVQERQDCDEAAARERVNWQPCMETQKLPVSEVKVKELLRKGVPSTERYWVWPEVSGANKKKAAHAANYYSIMLKAGETSPYLEEIVEDTKHTFPDHPWVASEEGQASIVRVLQAYSAHNDKMGYVRSLNTVVGLLLVVLNHDEEATFWTLAALVEDILFQGTYSRNLEGCQVEMKALDELISDKLPRLQQHFRNIDLDISILATEWYLALYSVSFPAETVCRIWDAMFNEGPKILFRVALAMLKIYEDKILTVDNAAEVVLRMRKAAATMHQRDILMHNAFDGIGSLSMATIDKYRALKLKEVENALAERGLKSGLAHTPSVGGNGSAEAADKMKAGFNKFMGGLSKLADKTAESVTQQMAKLKAKDEA